MRLALTLIEVLVVIAVIAILTALLFPVFAQVREKARQVVCISNEKQIWGAMIMYAQNHDELLPAPGCRREYVGCQWVRSERDGHVDVVRGVLFPYTMTEGIYLCPSDTKPPVPLSYVVNAELWNWPISVARQSTVLAVEEHERSVSNDGCFRYKAENDLVPLRRHFGTGNVLWLDGHVKAVPPNQLLRLQFDPAW